MENIKSVVSDGKNATEVNQNIEGITIEEAKIDNLKADGVLACDFISAGAITPDDMQKNTEQKVNEMGAMITNLVNQTASLEKRVTELEVQVSNKNIKKLLKELRNRLFFNI